MQDIRDFDRCLHGKAAPCSEVCPFGLDVRELIAKLQRGSFGPAYNLYRNAVAFPEIVARLCPAPCSQACAQGLEMGHLERAAIDFSRSREPVRFSLPESEKRIAVVGASLGGLACALRLAQKRHRVTIFEAEQLPGGSARLALPWDVLCQELTLQFRYAPCQYLSGQKIADFSPLAGQFDAVYLASGTGFTENSGRIFSDGSCPDTLTGLAAGIRASQEIHWYLQTGVRKAHTPVPALPSVPCPPLTAPYTKAEARQEAGRCTKCDCHLCVDRCLLLQQYGQSSRALARDIGVSTNLFHETQGHAAMREIGSCTDCGLCAQVCPVGIDIGSIILSARQILLGKGELPPAHHEYWLRDMAFANGAEASLLHLPAGAHCQYLFFPGCQAGGSDPRYVSITYDLLRGLLPNAGLLLRCCGAPALWSGEEALLRQSMEQLRGIWLQAGKPVMVFTCPSCMRMFRRYLPEIPQQSLYELPQLVPMGTGSYPSAAVFDPCASRDYPAMQAAVRKLARACGVELQPLPNTEALAQCCSWGGHGYCVNPLFIQQQAARQAAQSSAPYLCYCVNCRDVFASQGKPCRHILDDILGINGACRSSPTVTKRRENRRTLKKELACRFGLPWEEPTVNHTYLLHMTPEVAEKLSADLILEEEVCQVISVSEASGRLLIDAGSRHRIAHQKIGYLTYWVEYAPWGENEYELFNAYTHRMTIVHEEVSP